MSRIISLILLTAIILIMITTVFQAAVSRQPFLRPLGIIFEFEAGLQKLITDSSSTLTDFWQGYFFLINTRQENVELKKVISASKAKLSPMREVSKANVRLRSLLNFKKNYAFPIKGAQIVSMDIMAWFKSVVIDLGGIDGIIPGMPVISGEGVVGRIVEVTPHFSRVLLITDYNSSAGALIQRSRSRGVLTGKSLPSLSLKYVLKHDDVALGDQVITSGLGGVFPKGLVLGTVEKVRKTDYGLFLEVEVTPAVNFNKLEEVMVIFREGLPFD